ncbi:MAG: hypothetical protein M3065_19465 [Actinomycetota bacterium]|nr:hypothetical protein [Actinomycetota bacterium]
MHRDGDAHAGHHLRARDGRLAELSFADVVSEGPLGVEIDVAGEAGDAVVGPDQTLPPCSPS